MNDPIQFDCDTCQAKPGKKCTQPTDVSRVEVNWFHIPRKAAAVVHYE